MSTRQLVDESVQVVLLAASGPSALAAQTLSRHFGLTLKRAEAVLNEGHGLIAANIAAATARASLEVLAALGLQAAIQPIGTAPEVELYDLSIRLTNSFHAARLIRTLHGLVGQSNLTSHWFDGPSGMVVERLTLAKVEWLAAALRHISGVQVTSSVQRTAKYDLFSNFETHESDLVNLRRHLNLLGCDVQRFGDAVACGLDKRALDHVMARFEPAGIIGVNQDFARFDLLVRDRGRLSQQEFTDFMITRTGYTPNIVRKTSRQAPLRVESCLTRSAARHFITDYATIGISATARLVRQ